MLHESTGGVLHCHWRVAVAGAVAVVCYCTHARCDPVRILAGKGNHGTMTCLPGTLNRMRSWCRASEHSIPIRKTASDKRLENKRCPSQDSHMLGFVLEYVYLVCRKGWDNCFINIS